MKNVSNIGKLLAIIGVGFFVFGIVLMIFDDGRTLTSLAIPFIFLSFLVIMASILFIGEFNKKSFHINNFMFLFLLFTFNSLALFGAEFGGGAGPETFFAIGISYASGASIISFNLSIPTKLGEFLGFFLW